VTAIASFPPATSANRAITAVCYAGLALLYAYLVSLGFGPYVTDDHAFRQTQTALTSQNLNGWQDLFHYETPVLGPPWTVPFEFPLFQAGAKLLQLTSGWTLETAGRVLSVACFVLCSWPLSRALGWLEIRNRFIVIALVALTPLYVFWSRAFMIETAALLATLVYLMHLVEGLYIRGWTRGRILALLLAGTLAALIKITTFAPILLIGGVLLLHNSYHARRAPEQLRWLALVFAAHAVIVAVAWLWIWHTDQLKAHNPLTELLISSNLRTWNFGTLQDRFSPWVWSRLGNKVISMYFPFPEQMLWLRLLLGGMLFSICLYCLTYCSPRRRLQAVALAAMFLLPIAIFLNLHRLHNYYQVANGIFLTCGIGIAITGALEQTTGKRRMAIMGCFIAILASFVYGAAWNFRFKVNGQPITTYSNQYRDLTEFIRTNTAPESVIVITGQEFSSEIPYLSQRRALMLAEKFLAARREAGLKHLVDSGLSIGAYVACSEYTESSAKSTQDIEVRAHVTIPTSPQYTGEGCEVYLAARQL